MYAKKLHNNKYKYHKLLLVSIIAFAFAFSFYLLIFNTTPKPSSVSTIKKNFARILIQQEPDSLNPLFTSMSAAVEIQRAIYKPMVEIDMFGKPIPILVKYIPSALNNTVTKLPNGKIKVIWEFKEDLFWEDGERLSVADVIFAWKVIMDNRVWVRSRNLEKRIASMQQDPKNKNKLIVIWNEPYAYYYKGHFILPKHILEDEYKKKPEKLHLSQYNRKPTSNGPYKVSEWVLGNYILLIPNEYYKINDAYNQSHTNKGDLDGILYQFVGDTNSMILWILSGHADAISPIGISFDQALDLINTKQNELNIHIKDGIVWEHIDFNLDHHILNDIRIRQALMHGINRKHISKFIFNEKLKVSDSWLPPLHPGYSNEITKYDYSKTKAKALLAEAGFKYLDKDGILKNKDGVKLEIDLITTAGNKLRGRIQIAIKNDLKEIGVQININKNQNALTLFGQTLPKRKFELAMYAWIFSPLSDGEQMWTYDSIPNEKNNYIGDNIPGYKNKQIDYIHKTIPITLNENTRKELFAAQQAIWTQELPAIPLYFRAEVSLTRKGFINWQPTGTDTPITWNVEKWRIIRNN